MRRTRSREVGNISNGTAVKVSAVLGRHARSAAAVAAVLARAVCCTSVNLPATSHANRDEPYNAPRRCITPRSTRRTPASRRLLPQASRRGARALTLR